MTDSLKQQMLSGVMYTAVAKYSGILISLVVAGILGRLLTPDDFGVVLIATVAISFFGLFTDMGISAAVVQNKELTEEDLSDIFMFTIWMGIGVSVLFFFASWPIAAFYESEILRTLLQLLSFNFFFSAVTIVPGALFYKNKEFKYIAIRSFSIQVSTGIVSIVAALMGAGMYALIIAPIASSLLMFGVSLQRYPQKLHATWGMGALRKILGYSTYQFMFNLINFASRNLDKLLLGKFMDMSTLGYYEKSYRLMMLPLQNITQVITPVMHPILSDYQDNLQRLGSSYERIVRLLAFIGIPLSVFLFFTAEEATILLFGPQWMPSVPVFRILALSVGVQVILSSSGSIYQAAGDTRSLFICGVFSSVLNVIGMCLGIFYFRTLEALAACITVTFTINFIQCYWQMYRVTLKRSMLPFLRQLLSPVLLAALAAVVMLPLSLLLEGGALFVNFMVKGFVFVCIFGVYIQLSKEFDVLSKVKSVINKRK